MNRPIYMSLLFAVLLRSHSSNAAVNLTSSADSVCPGDTVVFTCVTDTGRLTWSIGSIKQIYYSSSQVSEAARIAIFTLRLINVTNGSVFTSTATAHGVSFDNNGKNVICLDSSALSGDTAIQTIRISPPPSLPLNLMCISSPILSSVTVSWVAPLDTPLCVHSYTVIVRNSCNSSQVMVYNTTDNKSSLSITELIADGEYSVTVAGRDGAGRLGEESEVLRIRLNTTQAVAHAEPQLVHLGVKLYGMFLKWKPPRDCHTVDHYLIRHNVSGDQSPITVNRTNVTLYGVQPGETYYVEITPYPLHGFAGMIHIGNLVPVEPTIQQLCIVDENIEESLGLPVGLVSSIFASVVIALVLVCYLLLCIFARFTTTRTPSTRNTIKTDATPDLLPPVSENECCEDLQFDKRSNNLSTVGPTLPMYDYVRHQ